jgi:UDP-GlcNAc:undecaprenyl-phosphate GlcNAc-1-phosphate transferase
MNAFFSLFPLVFGPLLVTALAIPSIKRLAWRLDLVDRPGSGAHKSHERPIPYGGGLSIFLGLAVALALVSSAWVQALLAESESAWGLGLLFLVREWSRHLSWLSFLLAGGLGLLFVGLLDDWRGLPPLPRFVVQLAVIAALVASVPACRLALFPGFPFLDLALTVLWIGAMTNAFNFLDNMDGLSAGIAAIALVFLSFMALLSGEPALAVPGLALFGALCGFLLYNLPPASIFMGDAGGLFLGFFTSSMAVVLSQTTAHATLYSGLQLAPLLVLSVPVYDFLSVNLIRLRNGAPPWRGDKNHVSHRLVRLGLSRRNAVLAMYLATLLTGLPALLDLRPGGRVEWLLAVPAFLAVVALIDHRVYRRPPLPPS